MIRITFFLALSACALLLVAAPASADGKRGVSRCQDQAILKRISDKFAWAERNTWHRGFVIDEIVSPNLRYQVNNGPTTIRHDHCTARAIMTDGSVRRIYYTVERRQGFASIGDNVQFCIVGLDPWRVHGAACSTVR